MRSKSMRLRDESWFWKFVPWLTRGRRVYGGGRRGPDHRAGDSLVHSRVLWRLPSSPASGGRLSVWGSRRPRAPLGSSCRRRVPPIRVPSVGASSLPLLLCKVFALVFVELRGARGDRPPPPLPPLPVVARGQLGISTCQ